MENIVDIHKKRLTALRHLLVGLAVGNEKYYNALRALEFVKDLERGTRKDGVTPSFFHQVSIALHVMTFRDSLLHPAETVAVALLHDIAEDHGVGFEELEKRFGSLVADATRRVTKKFRGSHTPYDVYFSQIAECPVASVVKGCDRVNNYGSMVGVFTIEKQKAYLQEGNDYFLPMLKAARRNFPEQETIYYNLKMMIESQIDLITEMHAVYDKMAVNELPEEETASCRM